MCERAEDPQEALASAIDALAAVDTTLLADQDLHDHVMALQNEMSRLAAIRACLVAAWDGRGAGRGQAQRRQGRLVGPGQPARGGSPVQPRRAVPPRGDQAAAVPRRSVSGAVLAADRRGRGREEALVVSPRRAPHQCRARHLRHRGCAGDPRCHRRHRVSERAGAPRARAL